MKRMLRIKRHFTEVVIVIIVFPFAFALRGEAYAQDAVGNQTEAGVPFKAEGQLLFLQKGSGKTLKMITIQIADNDQERAQGLMWRYSMPEDEGMLFIFDKQQVLDFWMKNTYIPLDMVFADESGRIVDIFRNAAPLNESNISSNKPALYCVEVNGGFCTRYGIKTGDTIEFMR